MDTSIEIHAFTILAPFIITGFIVLSAIGFGALAKHVYDIEKEKRSRTKSVANHHKND
jgi:hypothetical protein